MVNRNKNDMLHYNTSIGFCQAFFPVLPFQNEKKVLFKLFKTVFV